MADIAQRFGSLRSPRARRARIANIAQRFGSLRSPKKRQLRVATNVHRLRFTSLIPSVDPKLPNPYCMRPNANRTTPYAIHVIFNVLSDQFWTYLLNFVMQFRYLNFEATNTNSQGEVDHTQAGDQATARGFR